MLCVDHHLGDGIISDENLQGERESEKQEDREWEISGKSERKYLSRRCQMPMCNPLTQRYTIDLNEHHQPKGKKI